MHFSVQTATVTSMPIDTKPKVIAVVGPTAAGKTGIAIELALRFNGEVISVDSRQIYRKLDIGTAKVTKEEMKGVPHHLIDIVDIDTVYTANDFLREADTAITDISERGKLPIVAGGTLFYVELLRRTMQPAPVPPNYMLRSRLDALSTEALLKKLTELDPRRAATIDPHNRRRLIRAIEIVDTLGAVPPALSQQICPYQILLLGVTRAKSELRERFALRAKTWLEAGLLQEVEGLLKQGISQARLKELGFEYTLTLSLLTGEIDTETFYERFVQKNWQYAKRQMTWLQRDNAVRWVDPDNIDEIANLAQEFLAPS